MKYLLSACLAGRHCRFDGASRPVEKLVRLHRQGHAVLVCPESLSGLPIPRLPCEQKNGRVYSRDGTDMTAFFEAGANAALGVAMKSDCTRAILKARSPSCGVGYIYDGTFGKSVCKGNGIFARKLLDSGFEITDEEHLEVFDI